MYWASNKGQVRLSTITTYTTFSYTNTFITTRLPQHFLLLGDNKLGGINYTIS